MDEKIKPKLLVKRIKYREEHRKQRQKKYKSVTKDDDNKSSIFTEIT